MLDALSRLRAPVAPTLWQRRWAVVWNAGADLRTEADWLAYHLPRLGFEVVCVKVTDGAHGFRGSAHLNLDAGYWQTLKRAGLRLAGWGYLYGYDPVAEARAALQACAAFGLEAFVADAEKEFEYDPLDSPSPGKGRDRYAASRAWVAAWGARRRRPQLGLTSYGRVDLHRLDWAAWAKAGARFCPQAYANESAQLAPALCADAASVYWDRRFVHPWVGVYPGAIAGHDPAAYEPGLRLARTRGFAAYVGDTMGLEDYRKLGRAR